MDLRLTNTSMHDGSRHFASVPESASAEPLKQRLEELEGVVITRLLTDRVTESWIDFDFHGCRFTVNNQMGEYWFFVNDPKCPEATLATIVDHASRSLR
jgi:hypothetical protein